MQVTITEYDVVFISYDEPNADENFADLLNKCPWAKRSHGVFGSDAAHKAAANLSETERFVGIDADNIVDPDFFNMTIDTEKIKDDWVISWSGKNDVNGLVYGNGGIKCWPKKVVENMRTHEASNPKGPERSHVEFCWDVHYVQMNNIYSDVHNNSSPYQAYRAGFREGVKMSLSEGKKVLERPLKNHLHYKNYNRLLVWLSVGADAENGMWALYGARLGCYKTNLEHDWDWSNVRDFVWHTEFWENEIAPQFKGNDATCPRTGYSYDKTKLITETQELGRALRNDLGLNVAEMDALNSKFFKEVYINPIRTAPLIRETQIEYEVFK